MATPVLKAVVKSTKVKLNGNNVRNVIIAHVIIVDTHTILRQASCTPAGKNHKTVPMLGVLSILYSLIAPLVHVCMS